MYHIPMHFLMLNMAIHVDQLLECTILIKSKFQIQLVTFRRGHPGTPIDPAPVLLSGMNCSTSHLASTVPSVSWTFVDWFHYWLLALVCGPIHWL